MKTRGWLRAAGAHNRSQMALAAAQREALMDALVFSAKEATIEAGGSYDHSRAPSRANRADALGAKPTADASVS